ncbi:MAG TPA: hypothetical protein VHM20_00555, partial [Gammaproteobacteria bacterium]|nr:hypothetical protein [Gammaproteobacteria bacterium]
MQKSKTLCPKNFAFLGFFIGVIFFSWKIQSHLLLNWDVSWCLHTAAKLIAGGDYVKDFLQVDLPLTLYLYSPAIFLAEHYSISLMLASQIYLMYLGILSVAVSYYFLHKNFKNNDLFICLITLCSALILFVLPAENYGQREHLFLMFTLPYFFMLTLRWQGLWIHPLIAVLLGCSAGIGFLIKPYFFMTFLLLELYYLFYSKNKFSWYRPEVITIIFLTLLYGNFINIFQPNIIHINIPFIQKYFYASFALTESWTQILTRGAIFYALAAFLFFFIIDKNHFPYKELTHILFIATVGSLFSYLVQRTSWPYHFLPLVALTSLLWLVLCFQFFQKNTFNNHKQWIFVTVFICLISFYPIKFFLKEYHAGIFYRERTALLIQYLRQHANNQSVFFISTLLQDGLPAVDYANANLVGRSVFLPMFPAILKKIATEANPEKLASLKQDESFFMKMIIDDLNEKKPRFVFIDKRQQKMYLDKNFEYLPYFTKDV